MKIYKGKTGLDASWQEPFTETMECHKCKGKCRIMFVAMEDEEDIKGDFIADLYENTGGKEKGKFWVHDACAIAVYLCEKCFEPNAKVNQA